MMWTEYYKDLPIPSDWENVSYGNDELPSFACNGYQIWINSPDLEERKESYLGLGFGTLTDYEDWIFHVRYYFDEETKKEHIKKEKGYLDGFYFSNFEEVVNFVNKPSLYALLCLLELNFNWQIPFHKFDENELLQFIEDLLNGKTEYKIDDKFPKEVFTKFLKENEDEFIDFDKMDNSQKLSFLMERNGYVEDGIGLNEYGHEFRDDEGQALFIDVEENADA